MIIVTLAYSQAQVLLTHVSNILLLCPARTFASQVSVCGLWVISRSDKYCMFFWDGSGPPIGQ